MTQAPEYRLVPIEPTEAMVEAARDVKRKRLLAAVEATQRGEEPNTKGLAMACEEEWRAMIAAAPHTAAPAADRTVSELVEKFEKALICHTRVHCEYQGKAMPDDIYRSFAERRDERIPALRAELLAATAPPADRAELVRIAKAYTPCRSEWDGTSKQQAHAAIEALARSTDAPSEEEIGALVYRGNAVSFIKDRATAYGDEIMRVWYVLKDAGLHPGRTDDKLHEVVRSALATPPAAATSTPCASGEGAYHAWAGDIDAEAMLRRAASVMEDVLTDIEGWEDKALSEAVTASRRDVLAMADGIGLAATQAPAVPASGERAWVYRLNLLESCANWLESRSYAQVLRIPNDPIEGGGYASLMRGYAQDLRTIREFLARTPTVGNTEDARSMGAVPAEVTAWVKAEGERIAAVHAYNAARAAAQEHEFGRVDLNPHFQRMTETANAAHRLVEPMYAALTQAASTGGKS